jgi:Zn-finger nucleic acid-binding protein
MELTCPKCHAPMRTYERNGVHVDQCTDCRGIFLDRGELDRLIDAENAWHGGAASEPPRRDDRSHEAATHQQPAAAQGAGLSGVVGEVLRQVQGSKSSSHKQSEYGHRRKKESFLGDLFG